MYSNSSVKISSKKIVAVFIMVFSFMGGYLFFTGDAGTIRWYVFYYGRFFLMIAYAFYSYGNRSRKGDRSVVRWMNKLLNTPLIIMLIYSFILWLLYHAQFRYITRGISNFIFMAGANISGIYMAKSLGKDAMKLGIVSAIITMVVSMLIGLMSLGSSFFVKMIEGSNIYVELHEALFVIGLYIIVYMFREQFFERRRNVIIFFLGILSFILGGKRIGFLAIVLAIIYGYIIKHRRKRTISMICHVIGWVVLIFSIIYTWISVSGTLDVVLKRYGIDMMGREVLYRYFRKFCEYTPTFLGHGIGFVDRTFGYTTNAELYNMASVKALHNDFFKRYLELGFFGSIIWAFYWIKMIPNKIEKRFGHMVMLVCFCMILYSFVTYTTDNTAGYFNYQLHLSLLITSVAMSVENERVRNIFAEIK